MNWFLFPLTYTLLDLFLLKVLKIDLKRHSLRLFIFISLVFIFVLCTRTFFHPLETPDFIDDIALLCTLLGVLNCVLEWESKQLTSVHQWGRRMTNCVRK